MVSTYKEEQNSPIEDLKSLQEQLNFSTMDHRKNEDESNDDLDWHDASEG